MSTFKLTRIRVNSDMFDRAIIFYDISIILCSIANTDMSNRTIIFYDVGIIFCATAIIDMLEYF